MSKESHEIRSAADIGSCIKPGEDYHDSLVDLAYTTAGFINDEPDVQGNMCHVMFVLTRMVTSFAVTVENGTASLNNPITVKDVLDRLIEMANEQTSAIRLEQMEVEGGSRPN